MSGRASVESRLRTRASGGFTLLELVVVLAILAAVTAIASRELSQVEDQRRFEATQKIMRDIEEAVLGSPDDRAADGSRTISGFVADMGRLPRPKSDGTYWTLSELWANPGVALFDLRLALTGNGVAAENRDKQVLVPGGWRGPYLRLPLGTSSLLDGWGNGFTSPAGTVTTDTDTANYPRLCKADGNAVTSVTDDIRFIRHLGANGRFDPADQGYESDGELLFPDAAFEASVSGKVDVVDSYGPSGIPVPATPDITKYIVIRLFAPNPANLTAPINVYKVAVKFTANPVLWSIPMDSTGPTIGPRVVRAYLNPEDLTLAYPTTTSTRVSSVETVTLRGGANQVDLVIDRTPPSPIDQ